MNTFRVGHGYDVHRLVTGRKLILGGVEIPFDRGLLGHSDADALTHAVIDALLGAAGLGDIGTLFPDSDTAYAGISSLLLLDWVAQRLREAGWQVGNLDATLIAQQPNWPPMSKRWAITWLDIWGSFRNRSTSKLQLKKVWVLLEPDRELLPMQCACWSNQGTGKAMAVYGIIPEDGHSALR